MVSVRLPVPALLPTLTVRVEVPEPATEVGLKLAFTRPPNPLTLRLTVPLNPFWPVIVTVYWPEVPRLTASVEGDTEMVKSGVPPEEFTVSVIVVV